LADCGDSSAFTHLIRNQSARIELGELIHMPFRHSCRHVGYGTFAKLSGFSRRVVQGARKRHGFDNSDHPSDLLLIGALPTWPYSAGWGYYPGGGLGLILIIVIILAVAGRL
jgi:Protein of unknown function (DUF3309)